jgi:virulence factor Mce-like protein
LLRAEGNEAAAEDAFRRADQRGDALGALRLGELLGARGEWDQAKEAYARAEERGVPKDAFDLPSVIWTGTVHDAPVEATRLSAFANPVLIGAVALLVTLIAVFLAYTANGGLPFVPTRELKVDIGDGSNLVPGNDVLEGGHRIGFVFAMQPVRVASGATGAQLTLKLSQNQGKIPVDSTVDVRLRTVLGSKYVDLVKGRSQQAFPDGGTLPIAQTDVPVQLDQVFNIFNPPTRLAVQQNLQGFGDTFAARGGDLNTTIQALPALLQHLQPVAAYLSAPSTQLTRFFDSLNGFTGAVAPVSGTLASLFGDAATTFQAISSNPANLEATIARSPSTLAVSTDSLRTQQPFLVDLTTFGGFLSPATSSLRAALPDINPAIEAGSRTLGLTPVLNSGLQKVMSSLKSLAQDPGTNIALNGLLNTVGLLNPMVRYLGPYVTVCNEFNYTWTYLQDVVSEPTSFGTAQRGLLMSANPAQPNNPATSPASGPQNGNAPGGDTVPLGGNGFMHAPAYGSAIDNFGNADCEAGQRGYVNKLNAFDPQGRNLETDAHIPGLQGTTFAGSARVPAGETFSRAPQIGPQLPNNPSNP